MLRNISTVCNIHSLKHMFVSLYNSPQSEVQHTKYLLGQLYSEFANCLSKEHLISVCFAVVGMHAVVCFAWPSQRYNISYPPPKMLPRINNEQAENSCNIGSHFGAQQRRSPADTTVSSSGSTALATMHRQSGDHTPALHRYSRIEQALATTNKFVF